MLSWIEKTIRDEYADAENEPDYRHFLKAKFNFLNDKTIYETENDYG